MARVVRLVGAIPEGKVTTYGSVARALGDARKSREVGWVLAALPDSHDLPAHRVVNRVGRLSGAWAFGHPDMQRVRLEIEGVTFQPDGRVDLSAHYWAPEAPIAQPAPAPARKPAGALTGE